MAAAEYTRSSIMGLPMTDCKRAAAPEDTAVITAIIDGAGVAYTPQVARPSPQAANRPVDRRETSLGFSDRRVDRQPRRSV